MGAGGCDGTRTGGTGFAGLGDAVEFAEEFGVEGGDGLAEFAIEGGEWVFVGGGFPVGSGTGDLVFGRDGLGRRRGGDLCAEGIDLLLVEGDGALLAFGVLLQGADIGGGATPLLERGDVALDAAKGFLADAQVLFGATEVVSRMARLGEGGARRREQTGQEAREEEGGEKVFHGPIVRFLRRRAMKEYSGKSGAKQRRSTCFHVLADWNATLLLTTRT